MVLLIDNFDSFTYNIYHYLLCCGLDCRTIRSDRTDLDSIRRLQPEGLVLSPGPKAPSDHPLLFRLLETFTGRIPILGVCLGHQAIGEFFGARLERAPEPVHGKAHLLHHNGHPMYAGIPSPTPVGRYHSLVLEQIPEDELEITARTENGLCMSVSHRANDLWGIQFHPESVLSPKGMDLLRNWAAKFD